MTRPIVGVLTTKHRKHLLVNSQTRRTACGKVMKAGMVHEGFDLGIQYLWDSYYLPGCPECAKEWFKGRKKRRKEL